MLLVALGISLIYSGLDIVHFAHGEIYIFGAFFGLITYRDVGLLYPLAMIFSMLLTAVLGIFIERFFYRCLTRSGGGYTIAGMGLIAFSLMIILQSSQNIPNGGEV